MSRKTIGSTILAATLAGTLALAADDLVTVRFGEQDSCKLTGVTTLEYEKEQIGPHRDRITGSTIRFDLSKLPAGAKVARAVLRQWVQFQPQHAGNPAIKAYCGFYAAQRWREEVDFDGFKVWQVGGPQRPLSVVFPFAYGNPALHEWDVTAAVQTWARNPQSNQGLRLNVPLLPIDFEYAWMRPYLQVTYASENPDRPKQPTQLTARYRSGQVFLSWKQIPYEGAFFDSTYRVYRHARPITAENLREATLLGEVHKNSQLNYRRTVQTRGLRTPNYAIFSYFRRYFGDRYGEGYKNLPRFNFVIDDTWPERVEHGKWRTDPTAFGQQKGVFTGPELSDDTGLFVHTVKRPGPCYFAVTSVIEGNENRRDFTPGNALAQAVEAKVDKPQPVLQTVYYDMTRQPSIVLEYVFWGGPGDELHVEPSTPFYFHVNPPLAVYEGDAEKAKRHWTRLGLSLGGNLRSNVGPDLVYIPPTRLAPIPPTVAPWANWDDWYQHYYPTHQAPSSTDEIGFSRINHGSRSHLNRFGYHDRLNTGKDPRQAVVRSYRENVLLRCIEYYQAMFPAADRNKVCVMSQGNTLMLGLHHPEVFASVGVGQEVIWTAKIKAEIEWELAGLREWNLKTPQGHNVWQWNDPVWYSRHFPELVWPFVDMLQSPNYARADQTHWNDSGYPGVYLELAKDKRGGRWWWCDIGDAPSPANPGIPLDEPYLAFTNVNFCAAPVDSWRKCPRGTLNGYLEWQSRSRPYLTAGDPQRLPEDPPEGRPFPYGGRRPDGSYIHQTWAAVSLELVDAPARFAVGIRIGDHGRRLNGQSVPPTLAQFGKTDITPWRLQNFRVEPGRKYLWTNTDATTGAPLQSGVITPDERGLLTVPGFFVDREILGNVLEIVPADGKTAPAVDKGARVAGLPLAEYVSRCEQGILFPKVTSRAPFKCNATEFLYFQGEGADDGSVAVACGDFGGHVDTRLDFEKAGQYVFEVRARAKRGVCWPTLGARLGAWGTRMGVQRIVSTDWQTYRWFCDVGEPGLTPLRLFGPMDYYRNHWLAGLGTNQLEILSLTVRHVDSREAQSRPVDLRILPDFAEVPVGMPVRCSARILNALGRSIEGHVRWSAEGGTIDTDGLLVIDKPGACTVTAKTGQFAATSTIIAGDRLSDYFDEGNGTLAGAWQAIDLDTERPSLWKTPDRGFFMLNSLGEYNGAPSILIWAPGTPWTDYTVEADMLCRGPKHNGSYGLIFRALNEDNHCRLEIHRDGEEAVAKLIQVEEGQETIIAEQPGAPPLAKLDWKNHPTFTAWHEYDEAEGRRKSEAFGVDRMKVEVRGKTLTAWLGNVKLFTGVQIELAIPHGAPGLYSASPGNFFDNFDVAGIQPK